MSDYTLNVLKMKSKKYEDYVNCINPDYNRDEELAYEVITRFNEYEKEIQELKEKIETYENPEDLTLMFMYCDEKAKDKIRELEKQQKQFIEYLENEIYNIVPKGCGINFFPEDGYDSEEDFISAMKEQSRLNTLKEILSKFKEIIGVSNDSKK